MYLSKIKIKNYRLLVDATLDVDQNSTLIVGRNNTAKTSLLSCIHNILNGKHFSFDDYPINKRKNLYEQLRLFKNSAISFSALCEEIEPISITLEVDYSKDNDDDNLGALSPFIIDINPDITKALIYIEYRLIPNEKKMQTIIEQLSINDVNDSVDIASRFNDFFEMKIYAVNPNGEDDKQLKSLRELQELFPCLFIPAERVLGEDEAMKNSLSELISNFFNSKIGDLDESIIQQINNLRDFLNKSNKNIQEKADLILSDLVNDTVGFGYPNTEELQLGVSTNLDFNDQIISNSMLSYRNVNDGEKLPNTHNGLGYKNLIKIEFLLATFADNVKKNGNSCIPLLLIEEPESHMHPQMQNSFSKYLEIFLNKISNNNIQTFMTTHSIHIANTIDFTKIRYAQKSKNGVLYKNLKDFVQSNNENIDFIKKYLTLTKCDLFFADKVILVEGASERLLIPDMIKKCNEKNLFDSRKYTLYSQYYAIIEIGGAFAHKFVPFIQFLEIPCLIITDIDSCSQDSKKALVSKGELTSNNTIKWWFKQKKNNISKVNLNDIISMTEEDKSIGNLHIEFQTKENGICGRSLEEAIMNVNRSLFEIPQEAKENDIEYKGKSKTDFALSLIEKHENYEIPLYIKNGLTWLNDQNILK